MNAAVSLWDPSFWIFLFDRRSTGDCWWKRGFFTNFGLKIRLPLREVAPPAPVREAEDPWVGFLGIGFLYANEFFSLKEFLYD